MTSRTRPIRLLLAVGVVASMIPFAAPAPAEGAADPVYSGFATTAWASPLRVEVYEPSIPLPASPQLEFEMGYSKVKAASDQSSGRASWFWPGDPVGEGFGTFAEVLGLPSDNPLTADGYPVQVNSQYPGDRQSEADEPVPGMVMRTTAGDRTALAEVGFSPDGTVRDPGSEEDAPEDGGGGGGANPLDGIQGQLGILPQGGLRGPTAPAADTPSMPGLPPELAALVDMDAFASISEMTAQESPVHSTARSGLGELRLLGGVITIGGLEVIAHVTSDGAEGVATGKTSYGRMRVGEQAFEIGPDGIEATGRTTPIPGLNDDPAKALEQLGITIETPKPEHSVEGDLATSLHEGLRVTIDTKVLAPALSALPASQLSALVPAEAGPLKGIVAGLSTLAPRIVLTLGVASATVDTVPPIDPVAPPPPPEPDADTPPAAPGGGVGDGGDSGGAPPAGGGPASADDAPTPSGDVDELGDVALTSGLPKLFSIPGMLLIGAFAGAAAAGSWFRRLGAAALGGGASCPHGLASGLPDLRKA